jgi:hypothetical protein
MTGPRTWTFFLPVTLLVACVTAYRGFFELFSHFSFYDDTGYMLSLIRGFNEHGHLYQAIFSQYGPFYSELYYLVCRICGVPVTQDAIRWVVLALWSASSVAGAAVAFQLTGRVWISIIAQLLCFHLLYPLSGEPGHPISLVVTCLGAIAVCLMAKKGEQLVLWQGFVTGALLGALLMIKVNLGVFALAAVGSAWVYCTPLNKLGRLLRWVVGLLFCLLPLLLIKEGWPLQARAYFIALFICSLLGILISARGQTSDWQSLSRFGLWTLTGLGLSSAISLLGALLTGTGLDDLIDGIIRRPMHLAEVFSGPLPISSRAIIAAIFAVLVALARRSFFPAHSVYCSWVSFGLRLLFMGIVLTWLAMFRNNLFPNYLTWVLPFLWIAVLPPARDTQGLAILPSLFGRLSLALLAVSQVLGLYPVSSVQMAVPVYIGSLSFLLVGESLIVDLTTSNRSHGLSWVRRIPAIALSIGFAVVITGWFGLVTYRLGSQYNRFSSLALPGANLLRIEELSAARYRFLAENLRDCRPSFLTIPGLNSLYGWAGVEYPTGFNTGENFALLSHEQQREMVQVGRRCQPIALVFSQKLVDFWTGGRFQPSGPLIDFIRTECRPVGHVGDYALMTLLDSPTPTLTYCAILDKEWRADQPDNRVTVSLPASLGKVTTASLLDTSRPETIRNSIGARTTLSKLAPINGVRQFVFEILEPETLSPDSLDHRLVQLWDDSDRLVADVPFLRSPITLRGAQGKRLSRLASEAILHCEYDVFFKSGKTSASSDATNKKHATGVISMPRFSFQHLRQYFFSRKGADFVPG